MWKKIKYFLTGFAGGILLCLGITRSKKDKSDSSSGRSAGDIDLSRIAELNSERTARDIDKLRRALGSYGEE